MEQNTCLCLSILIYKYYVMIMLVSTHRFYGRPFRIKQETSLSVKVSIEKTDKQMPTTIKKRNPDYSEKD